jgi:hypothetical protein
MKCSKESLLSAPTRAGRPKCLSDIAYVVICRASKISALARTFVLGEKKILDFANLPSDLSLHNKYPELVVGKLH